MIDPFIMETFIFKESLEYIFESSKYTPKNLKEIENLFNDLKKKPFDIELHKKIQIAIQTFTGIKKINFDIEKKMYNAYVLPMWDDKAKQDFSTIVKDFFITYYEKGADAAKMYKAKKIEEDASHIKTAHIVFGDQLLAELTAGECVAVLLHEIGHIFISQTQYPLIVSYLLKLALETTSKLNFLTAIVMKIYNLVIPSIIPIIALTTFFGIHGISFFDRITERKADEYAVKYGYGDELASTFVKFDKYDPNGYHARKKSSFFIKIIRFFMKALTIIWAPSTHPDAKDRIKNIKKQMAEEYIQMYPEISTQLKIVLKDMGISTV